MAAVAQYSNPDNYKTKEVDAWSKVEVQAFLSDVVPNHPCINCFQYTSGHVLATLEKEDIRKQAKDAEAANIIWTELAKFQNGAKQRGLTTSGEAAYPGYTIFVRTPAEIAMEFEVSPKDTVLDLKTRLSDLEGTPIENQRLVWNGIHMADHKTLESYKIQNGACVLLVPHLCSSQRFVPPPAPRGMLMVPGNKSWQPAHSARPYIPVVASDAPMSMNVEFSCNADHTSFLTTAQKPGALKGAPVLQISLPDGKSMTKTVDFDHDSEIIKLDGKGLAPSTHYTATLQYGTAGIVEQKQVTVITGTRTG